MTDDAGANRNGSQFFITLAALANLNEKHVVFGEVTSGMEVVQEISKLATDEKQRPLERVVIRDCGEIRDGKDIRASEAVEECLPSTTPFGFSACKPTSFTSVANSKESPFSAPSSTKSGDFGSTNASPFSFSASSPKPFNFGGAGATKPFSFAASASSVAPSVPSKGFGFASLAEKTEVVNDTDSDDDSSQSSASSNSTAPSEDSSNEEQPSTRQSGFSETSVNEQSSTTSGLSFSSDPAALVKPFRFAAPTLKNQIDADKADPPKPLPSKMSSAYPPLSSKAPAPYGGGKTSTSTSTSTTSSSSAFGSGETVPVFGTSSKLGGGFASAPAPTKAGGTLAYPPLSSKAPVPFGSEKTDTCASNESSIQTPAPVFGTGGSVPIFGSSSSSGGGFAALASKSPAQTTDKGVSSADSPFGAFTKSTIGTSPMVKPLFGGKLSTDEGDPESSGSTDVTDKERRKDDASSSDADERQTKNDDNESIEVDKQTRSNIEQSSLESRRMMSVSSQAKPETTAASISNKPPTNPLASINFVENIKADTNQLKQLVTLNSPSSDVASSTEISEVNSQSSTDAVSPRDTVASTKPNNTVENSSEPTGSGTSLFADFAHGKPVDAPKIDRTQQETKTKLAFGGMTAVGQPSVTSKLPKSDNPFKTFSVSKPATAPASTFSFGATAASTATKDASSISSKEHNDNKTPSSKFSFGSISSAPISDKDLPRASDTSEDKKSMFSFGSSEANTTTFAFAQSSSNDAPKSPVGSPSRFSGWFASPKDKKD